MTTLIKKYNICENALSCIVMCIFSFIFSINSPLHVFRGRTETDIDSSVFKTVSMMMKKWGGVPYLDSFDHKGPLLYLINYVGDYGKYRGIWVIEMIFLAGTFWGLYKIARLMCDVAYSYVITLICISPLFKYYEGGNFTEEYSMLFIVISLYIFLDFFINNEINKLRLIICGISFGCVLLLRVNMVSLWGVFCIAILIHTLKNENINSLFKYIIWFLIGVAIIVIPIVIWLAVKGALTQCWEDYIVFNMLYTSKAGGRALLRRKIASFFYFLFEPLCIISVLIVIYMKTMKQFNSFLNVTYIIYIVFTLYSICISGLSYNHYGMILVPAFSYPIAMLINYIYQVENNNGKGITSFLLVLYLVGIIIVPSWSGAILELSKAYETKNDDLVNPVVNMVVEQINNHCMEEDTISVYGNWDIIYVLSGKKHSTRYSYQYPVCFVDASKMEDYMNQLYEEQPKCLVVSDEHDRSLVDDFINDNNYEVVWSEHESTDYGAVVYVKE